MLLSLLNHCTLWNFSSFQCVSKSQWWWIISWCVTDGLLDFKGSPYTLVILLLLLLPCAAILFVCCVVKQQQVGNCSHCFDGVHTVSVCACVCSPPFSLSRALSLIIPQSFLPSMCICPSHLSFSQPHSWLWRVSLPLSPSLFNNEPKIGLGP